VLLTHNGRQFALGVDWATAHDSGEVRRMSKARARACRVVRPVGGKFWLGLYDAPIRGKVFSAALAIGKAEPNAVVAERVSDTHSWLCSIQDGLPVVGYDLLVPNEEARDLASQWTASFTKSGFIGDLPGAKCQVASLLDEFEQLVSAKSVPSKDVAAMRLQKQGVSLSSIAGIVALGCLVIGLYAGWGYWQRLRQSSAAQQMSLSAAAQQAINAEKVAADRKRRTQEFQAQVVAARSELQRAESSSPTPLWRAWTDVRRSLPISSYGYSPVSLNCGTAECQVEWQGLGTLTQPVDKARLTGVIPNLEPTLAATSKFRLQPAAETREPGRKFASPQELRMAIVNAAIVAAPGLVVDAMTPVTLTPPADLGLQPVTVGARGRWRFAASGPTGPIAAEEVFKFLATWPVQLTSLQYGAVGTGSGGAITVEGTYVLIDAN
jgi:hypothetical protein